MKDFPAFPTTSISADCKGLTKREYIATHLAGAIVGTGIHASYNVAKIAVNLTDALLSRLADTTPETGAPDNGSKEKSNPEKYQDPRQEDLFNGPKQH